MKMHYGTLPKGAKNNVKLCPPATFGIMGTDIVVSVQILVPEEKLRLLDMRMGQNTALIKIWIATKWNCGNV